MSDSVLVACDAIVTAIKKPKKALAGRDPPYPQYVDDGQLALEVALVMRSARCFLQRQPWISTPRKEGAADVPARPDDAPFLLKVRWLLEALFHPLRAAPWHVAEGDAWGSYPGWTAA
jgi:hypothetical protein